MATISYGVALREDLTVDEAVTAHFRAGNAVGGTQSEPGL